MELTIEQALQQGVSAHKEGKLQEAERLYRAILQSQPAHPDANHNLGLIAVSVNKVDAALPLFKTALEVSPKIEQYWLSYIDALIKEKQFENAKQVFEQGKKEGLSGDKFDAVETQLTPTSQVNGPKLVVQKKSLTFSEKRKKLADQKKQKKAKKRNLKGVSPYQAEIDNLLYQFQSGRHSVAEKLAISITQKFPKHPLSWQILGAIFRQAGRKAEAVNANKKAVELSPQDAEAHTNLGITLKELGKLDEAKASFMQAIALKPNFAEAHNNLGNTLKELGKLEKAEASYNRAIAIEPDLAGAYNNLGTILQELGRLNEAEASFTKAIALKSDYAEAYSNLGVTLLEMGKLEKAEAKLSHAIGLKPTFTETIFNLSITQSYMSNLEAEIISLQNILLLDSQYYGLRAGVNLAICHFLKNEFARSNEHVSAAEKIQEIEHPNFNIEKEYQKYLRKLLRWHETKYKGVEHRDNVKKLYVIGESHSLASHNLRIQNSEIDFFAKARLIKGCKQWHLGNTFRNKYKVQFERIFLALPKKSDVLLAIGEIDCRLESGIIALKKKFPEKEIKEIVQTTIESYIDYIMRSNSYCQHKIFIQGVPCPNIDTRNHTQKDITQLVEVISMFNGELKTKCKKNSFGFLDVHKLTDNGDGWSNGLWHIDNYHLSPSGMLEAWRRYHY